MRKQRLRTTGNSPFSRLELSSPVRTWIWSDPGPCCCVVNLPLHSLQPKIEKQSISTYTHAGPSPLLFPLGKQVIAGLKGPQTKPQSPLVPCIYMQAVGPLGANR